MTEVYSFISSTNRINTIALGNVVSLETFGDPHVAAVLLKKYLRDLPEPIFPESLYPIIRRCPQPTNDPGDMSAVTFIREMLLPELPPCVYILLSNILREYNLSFFPCRTSKQSDIRIRVQI